MKIMRYKNVFKSVSNVSIEPAALSEDFSSFQRFGATGKRMIVPSAVHLNGSQGEIWLSVLGWIF